jgi:hypothetical protein
MVGIESGDWRLGYWKSFHERSGVRERFLQIEQMWFRLWEFFALENDVALTGNSRQH